MKDTTGSKPNIRLALLPFFSLIGTTAAAYLSKHYYELRAGTAGFKSLCNISSTINCDAVTSSRFAEIMPGLPLSSIVAGWFAALVILGLMARVKDWRKEAILFGTLMAGFGSLYSIALLVVMFFVLQKYCVFCFVIDAVNFALLGTYLSLLKNEKSGSIFGGVGRGKLQTNAMVVAGTVLVMIVLLRPAEENAANAPTKAELQYSINQILDRAPNDIKTPDGAAILGNPKAPITIHEFSDFQCPFCKRGAVLMNQLLARYDGKIRVIFMPFPLDQSCNRLITRAMHPYSCQLARSAYCASKEGKFQSVYEKFFEDQETLTADSALKIPEIQGLNTNSMKNCIDSEEAKKVLSLSIEEGIKFKVDATPTFFINGKKVDVSLPLEAWDELISAQNTGTK